MEQKSRLERLGIILGIVVAVISVLSSIALVGAFFGRIDERVSEKRFNELQTDALATIAAAEEAALKRIAAAPVGFIKPVSAEIGTSDQSGIGFVASEMQVQVHHLQIHDLSDNQELLGVWYQPTENIQNLGGFEHIGVCIESRDTIRLDLKASRPAAVRVTLSIMALYGPLDKSKAQTQKPGSCQ